VLAGLQEQPDVNRFKSHRHIQLLSACALAAATAVFSAGPAEAAGREVTVSIANMRYAQIPAGLKVGDTIVWQNRDSVPHTVTARDKSFDVRISPHQTARMTLDRAGSVPFYCIFHVQMRGTLTVGK
jgi:plastocyanin